MVNTKTILGVITAIFLGCAIAYALFCCIFPSGDVISEKIRYRIFVLLVLAVFWLLSLAGIVYGGSKENLIVGSLFLSVSTLLIIAVSVDFRRTLKNAEFTDINSARNRDFIRRIEEATRISN
jgi:hypothetical protein